MDLAKLTLAVRNMPIFIFNYLENFYAIFFCLTNLQLFFIRL